MDVTHAVGIIFENEDKEILILLRNEKNPEGGKWGLPGGKVTTPETPLETAVRKTKSEIGCTIEPNLLRHLKTYTWSREDINLLFDVFLITIQKGKLKLKLDPEANSRFQWINPQDAFKLPDLMIGLYPILKDNYLLNLSE